MSQTAFCQRHWITLDYGFLLPLLARLPLCLGRYLAAWRGDMYAWLQRDWRQFSFKDDLLHQRTWQTLADLYPKANHAELKKHVRDRYRMQSIEELEAAWLMSRDIRSFSVVFEGIEAVQALLHKSPHIVFVTGHFSSSLFAIALLGRLGVPILGMSSSIVDHPQVHPQIRRFFRRKYAAIGSYLGGGVLDQEGNRQRFARYLQREGSLVIVGDLPATTNRHDNVQDFFGARRSLAAGPVKLAQLANTPIIAFVGEFKNNAYHVSFSAPDENPYAFLAQHIRRRPSAWWAADVLPLMTKVTD